MYFQASSGMPMSHIFTVPHPFSMPDFASWNVTVTSGLTCSDVPNPVGTSQDTTFLPEEFTNLTYSEYSGLSSPDGPVPNTQSTRTSYLPSSIFSNGTVTIPSAIILHSWLFGSLNAQMSALSFRS